jgi:zinc protease
MIDARIVFPAGSAADPPDRHGVADLTARVIDLDEDRLYTRDEVAVMEWTQSLGTEIWFEVDELSTTFGARGVSTYADWHLWRLFWLLEGGIRAEVKDLKASQEEN